MTAIDSLSTASAEYQLRERIRVMQAHIDTYHDRVRILHDKLERFGKHDAGCPAGSGETECTCGLEPFDFALRNVDKYA